jgi:hypothetical protein
VTHGAPADIRDQTPFTRVNMRIGSLVGIALICGCARTLIAQDSTQAPLANATARKVDFRDPIKAAVLGTLIPGAGHVYSTEYGRGAGIYFATASSIGLGALVYTIDRCTFAFLDAGTCNPGPQWPHRTLGLLAVGAGVGMWIVGAIDAPRAAKRANERHRQQTRITPILEPRREASSGVEVGIGVTW